MAMELIRLPERVRLRRRYELTVTPPHAPTPWTSPRPLTHRQAQNKLYDFGNHTADIAAAFAAADVAASARAGD
jgi:hypothetical protein